MHGLAMLRLYLVQAQKVKAELEAREAQLTSDMCSLAAKAEQDKAELKAAAKRERAELAAQAERTREELQARRQRELTALSDEMRAERERLEAENRAMQARALSTCTYRVYTTPIVAPTLTCECFTLTVQPSCPGCAPKAEAEAERARMLADIEAQRVRMAAEFEEMQRKKAEELANVEKRSTMVQKINSQVEGDPLQETPHTPSGYTHQFTPVHMLVASVVPRHRS
jgi:DNA repair exonuclease SbcCD ATPase subunit